MKTTLLALLLMLTAAIASAQTSRNDDSCDVAALPAATLLVPYFEVDRDASIAEARSTLFTVVNTVNVPQIASVTIWTSFAYPVLTFDLVLTGYDVQAINLFDVLRNGVIAETNNRTAPGVRSSLAPNPNFAAAASTACANPPHTIPQPVREQIVRALTTGFVDVCGSIDRVGGVTPSLMTGYVTIDVVATCSSFLPTQAAYYDQLLYDNVLTGDWMLISPDPVTGNYASGAPMVHLRAIPEGGPAGEHRATNLPFTFYDRLVGSARKFMDRRQPLPNAFAARFVEGGGSGFNTDLLIWREGVSGPDAACDRYAANGRIEYTDIVRFDERENPFTYAPVVIGSPLPRMTPAASRSGTKSSLFPGMASPDVAGWLFLDLSNNGATTYRYAAPRTARSSQSWVVPVMHAEGRYSAAVEATAMGNGCSPRPDTIGPGPNVTP